jgi:tetratricopeptide (TPR) repeat protein
MSKLLKALALVTAMSVYSQSVYADQNDPRLNYLFLQLKAAESAAAASEHEDKIWRIWLEHPDKRTREVILIGIAFMNRGEARLAELAFTEALERNPEFAEAWNKRATLRYMIGDLEGSVADCANVLKLEPRHYGAMAGLGMISASQKNWRRAAEWYKRALEIHPHFRGAKIGLENALENLNAGRV